MSAAADLTWFVRHEIRLAWREWLAMMTGGRRRRKRVVIGLLTFAVILHLLNDRFHETGGDGTDDLLADSSFAIG
jgi:hypothetical protein